MPTYTNEILALIAKTPGIRQVEIADKIDCDLDSVPYALKEQIELGNVVRKWVNGPNGVPQVAYSMAPNSEDPESAADPAPAPVTDTAPAEKKTKVQMALDYLATVNKADDAQLRKAMGLSLGGNVRAYIATQLQKRQIIQIVGGYKLGDGKPLVKAASDYPDESLKAAQNAEQARLLREELSAKPKETASLGIQPGSASAEHWPGLVQGVLSPPEPILPQDQSFRCALWSDDGALTMMRGNQVIGILTGDELKQMLAYLDKINISTD